MSKALDRWFAEGLAQYADERPKEHRAETERQTEAEAAERFSVAVREALFGPTIAVPEGVPLRLEESDDAA